ncbi:MAG: hypothetical protein JNL67_01680 [Planctomycetaceae bacterium]|nr:hypothetical protein [Planctomycetaceae bacterium]
MRQRGSRNTLVKVDYNLIGRLAAISGDTAKQYAHRGEYNPRDLSSVLSWVNKRRQRQGKTMIGLPADQLVVAEVEVKHESDRLTRPAAPTLDLSGGYDPLLGGYRTDTAFRQ